MATRTRSAGQHAHDYLLIYAMLVSLALHVVAVRLMPALFQTEHSPADTLTVDLVPPPPKPLPPPEPPKPEPEKPKEVPKPTPKKPPPPQPEPVIQPRAESPPLPPRAAEPPPPAVIAAAPKASEPAPAVTVPVAPPEPPPPRPATVDLDAVRSNYGSLLSREFAKHKQYPRVALLRGWQGTVKVELQIDATGNIVSTSIAESSNYEALDKQALEMVRKASPLPLPPEALRGREFTIAVPVVFKIE